MEEKLKALAEHLAAALPGAVAVELVHAFSLVHDDIMDGDERRRHRSTTWKVYGVGPAVLAGDALLALAMATLASSDGLHRVRSVASVLRWVPPAPAVDAVRAAADGSYGLAVAELACVAAVLALVLVGGGGSAWPS